MILPILEIDKNNEALQSLADRLRDEKKILQASAVKNIRIDTKASHIEITLVPYIGNIQTGKNCNPFPMPTSLAVTCNEIKDIIAEHGDDFTYTFVFPNSKYAEPLMYMDLKYRSTRGLLDFLYKNNLRYHVHTCSDLIANDNYIKYLNRFDTVSIHYDENAESSPSFRRLQNAINKLKEYKKIVNYSEKYYTKKQYKTYAGVVIEPTQEKLKNPKKKWKKYGHLYLVA